MTNRVIYGKKITIQADELVFQAPVELSGTISLPPSSRPGALPLSITETQGAQVFSNPAVTGNATMAANAITFEQTMGIKQSNGYEYVSGIIRAVPGYICNVNVAGPFILISGFLPPFARPLTPQRIPVPGYVDPMPRSVTLILELQPNGDVHVYKEAQIVGWSVLEDFGIGSTAAYSYRLS